jgi:histidyl-tRNA synthetase
MSIGLLQKFIGPNHPRAKPIQRPSMIATNPVSGTRDFFPEDLQFRTWLFSIWRQVASRFAFKEYDCPILEKQELYKRKGGDDIVNEMYAFIDADNVSVALRPEMTPSLARLILSKTNADHTSLLLPIRWFSIPQCWRFENVQRGRLREHYQWNMDIIGSQSVLAEAELMSAIVSFFKEVGLTVSDVGLRVSSRNILNQVLHPIDSDQFAQVCNIIDKWHKLGKDTVKTMLFDNGLTATTIDTIERLANTKTMAELADVLGPETLAYQEMSSLFRVLDDYGISEWISLDVSIVRGLSYYTGIVFEGVYLKGGLRSICGGGRYDKLLSSYGYGKDIPFVGFGLGDCVIQEILSLENKLPSFESCVDDFVVPFNTSMQAPAIRVANILRTKGRRVDLQINPEKKIGWSFGYGDKNGSRRIILVAPDEWSRGCVRVKELRFIDGAKEKDVLLADL